MMSHRKSSRNTQALAVPLTKRQVEASLKLRARFPEWKVNEKAISQIVKRFTGFGEVATLIKVVFVNSTYGTRVFGYQRVCDHLHATLRQTNLRAADHELVERFARVPGLRRKLHSFASKFAHLFISPSRFPILDAYAEKSLKFHLGRRNFIPNRRRYIAFASNFARLKSLSLRRYSTRQLDHYLWLSGLYRAWKRKKSSRINKSVKKMFQKPSSRESVYLARLPVA